MLCAWNAYKNILPPAAWDLVAVLKSGLPLEESVVDGEVAQIGMRVDGSEIIRVDNELLARSRQSNVQVLLLNKRAGVICTRSDDQGRRTCFDELPSLREGRWISIGRLDIATSGLLLFTNDGELANRMMHPSTGLDREYAVRLDIRLSEEQVTALKTGVEIDPGEMAKFSDLRYFRGGPSNYWYHLVLMEGRNRQVRRMFEAVNARVSRLKRVRFGPVIVPPGVPRGSLSRAVERRYRQALCDSLGYRSRGCIRGKAPDDHSRRRRARPRF